MNLFWVTFESVGLLLGIGLVGFWIIARKVVPIDILKVLSPLVLSVALPCMAFTSIISKFNPTEKPDWYVMPIWWLAFTLIIIILATLFRYFSKKEIRREFYISLIYPNAIFTPLAIIPILFGKDSTMLTDLFIFTILFPAFLFNTYFLFYPSQNKERINIRRIFNGVFIGTLLAIIFKLTETDKHIPNLVLRITELLGMLSIPLIMILIGGNIFVDYQRKEKIDIISIIKFILVKNIIFPIIILFLLVWIKPQFNIAFLIFLMSALPPVTAISVFVDRAGGKVSTVNYFLIASFILSLITLPIAIMIFGNYFSIN
ncbi:MAG: AEC family transporter [Ignavibacteriales bacterium]|nr:AEC family transporter [Ignavibacteriales bacterium]